MRGRSRAKHYISEATWRYIHVYMLVLNYVELYIRVCEENSKYDCMVCTQCTFLLREWSEEDRTCGAIIVGRVALSERT